MRFNSEFKGLICLSRFVLYLTVKLCNLNWEFHILHLKFNSGIRRLKIDSLAEYAASG